MTDEMMSLRTLLEKSADADLLREMIGFAAHRLMELEVETLTGAAHGERSADRLTHRRYHDAWATSSPCMEAIMDQSEPVGTCDASVTVLVAIELSKSAWVLAVYDPITDKISRRRVDSGDAAGLIATCEKARDATARRSSETVDIECVFEAGYDGFWLQRRLEQVGIACRVMDPASLKVDRRARRVKTDRIDAESLLRALQAWRRGDRQACNFVRIPRSKKRTHGAHTANSTDCERNGWDTSTELKHCSRCTAFRTISRCARTGAQSLPSCAQRTVNPFRPGVVPRSIASWLVSSWFSNIQLRSKPRSPPAIRQMLKRRSRWRWKS